MKRRNILHQIAWGALGGAAFGILSLGYPVLFLVIFHDWNPGISREALRFLFYAPGPILGVAAWIVIYRYACRKIPGARI